MDLAVDDLRDVGEVGEDDGLDLVARDGDGDGEEEEERIVTVSSVSRSAFVSVMKVLVGDVGWEGWWAGSAPC